jgi:hypothetical protein
VSSARAGGPAIMPAAAAAATQPGLLENLKRIMAAADSKELGIPVDRYRA